MNANAGQSSAQALMTGVAAGLACALLAGSILTQTSLSVVLFLMSPIPVLAVGLAYGALSSVIAAIVATVVVSVGVQPLSGLVIGLTAAAPGAYAAWLLGLARPAEEVGGTSGDMVWFPLSDVVFRTALAIAVGFVLIGAYIGYSPDYAQRFAELFAQQMQAVNPEFTPSEAFAPSFAAFLYGAVPVIQPAMMVLAMLFSIHAGLKIARAMGLARRPREDWPTVLRMPRVALWTLAAAMALSFVGGGVGLVALAFSGAVGVCFVAAGLAIVHRASRGRPGRPLMLIAVYLGLFLFLPMVVVFLVIGLFDTTRAAPVTRGQP